MRRILTKAILCVVKMFVWNSVLWMMVHVHVLLL